MSRIEITGNLAADPEYALGNTTGRPYSRFTVVVNYRTKDPDDGTWSDGGRVGYRVVVFDQLADNVTNSLHKGDRVHVTGDYTVRDYQTSDGTRGARPRHPQRHHRGQPRVRHRHHHPQPEADPRRAAHQLTLPRPIPERPAGRPPRPAGPKPQQGKRRR